MAVQTMKGEDLKLLNAVEKPEEDRIDGYLIGDIIDYIGTNSNSYIEKFKAIDSGKSSWSWVGFLFPQLWFAYRKMIKWSAISLAVFIIPMTILINIYTLAVISPIFSAQLFFVLAFFLFLYDITMGLNANKIFMRKVFDDLGNRGLKGREPSQNNELKSYLNKKGRPVAANVIVVMIITTIFNLIIKNLISGIHPPFIK